VSDEEPGGSSVSFRSIITCISIKKERARPCRDFEKAGIAWLEQEMHEYHPIQKKLNKKTHKQEERAGLDRRWGIAAPFKGAAMPQRLVY